jgi:hypothetical protein
LSFRLAREAHAELSVLDARGRRIATLVDGVLSAGDHERVWDGCNAAGRAQPSGVYFAHLRAEGRSLKQAMVLLK